MTLHDGMTEAMLLIPEEQANPQVKELIENLSNGQCGGFYTKLPQDGLIRVGGKGCAFPSDSLCEALAALKTLKVDFDLVWDGSDFPRGVHDPTDRTKLMVCRKGGFEKTVDAFWAGYDGLRTTDIQTVVNPVDVVGLDLYLEGRGFTPEQRHQAVIGFLTDRDPRIGRELPTTEPKPRTKAA